MSQNRPEIDELRTRIAEEDRGILAAVARRMRLARQIGEAKSAAGLPVRNFATEKEVIGRARRHCRELGVDEELGGRLMQQLIFGAVKLQEDLQEGAYQGSHKRLLVVGGNGRMGRWLSRFFQAQGHEVLVHDPTGAPGGLPSVPLTAAGECEVVVVATPLGSTAGTLQRVLEGGGHGLVFDVASVKTPIIPLLRRHAAAGARVVSLHPMFGADVELLSDRNLLICRCGHDGAVAEARELFEETSLTLVEMEIEQHDPLIAQVLGLSHVISIAFFEALRRSGRPFKALLDVASTTFLKQARTAVEVARENPRLYHEIQHANAGRAEVFELLAQAIETLRAATEQADARQFESLVEAGRDYFGDWEPREMP